MPSSAISAMALCAKEFGQSVGRWPELFGAFFHCMRLSPITFIAVIAAWLKLA